MEPVRYDASTAECLVFTYKAGLLASVGHDLKLRVGDFAIAVDDGGIRGTFDAASLRVVCAQAAGRDDPRALSERDRRDIEAAIAREVLEARRHPAIEFRAKLPAPGAEVAIDGTLSIRGRDRALAAKARREGDRMVAETVVDQRAFDIRPYTAMLGALRVQPQVRVLITMPWPR